MRFAENIIYSDNLPGKRIHLNREPQTPRKPRQPRESKRERREMPFQPNETWYTLSLGGKLGGGGANELMTEDDEIENYVCILYVCVLYTMDGLRTSNTHYIM